MGCARTFCLDCGKEMIHRDNRRGHESASALGQIIHGNGPRQLTVGDIDLYAFRRVDGRHACIKLLEHKQPDQPLRGMQSVVLGYLDALLRHAAQYALFDIAYGSAVYVIRGELGPAGPRDAVNFVGTQIVRSLQGTEILSFKPNEQDKLYDWLCCGQPWTRVAR